MASVFSDIKSGVTRNQYQVKPMSNWFGVGANLLISDPPFGIEFDGKKSNYARDDGKVVDDYIEWDSETYEDRVAELLDVGNRNTVEDGQMLIFSGYDNSYKIHQCIAEHDIWNLEGKLYWCYNFAPYCKRRPAHNVYEIFWTTKSDDWYYQNECTHSHCTDGEANLSAVDVKRNYLSEMPKYPTRLPPEIIRVLLEHFTTENDVVFDPLAGSGSVGVVADSMNREYVLGDSNQNAKDVFVETRNSIEGGLDFDG